MISNLEYGGAQRQVVEIANALPRRGFDVRVCSLSTYVPMASHLRSPTDHLHVIQKRWMFDVSTVPRLAGYLRRVRADVVHGFLFYALLRWAWKGGSVEQRFLAAMLVEAAWEIIENTPMVIDRYREATIALGYSGDSILNNVSDIGMMAIGFVLARKLPVWASIGAVLLRAQVVVDQGRLTQVGGGSKRRVDGPSSCRLVLRNLMKQREREGCFGHLRLALDKRLELLPSRTLALALPPQEDRFPVLPSLLSEGG